MLSSSSNDTNLSFIIFKLLPLYLNERMIGRLSLLNWEGRTLVFQYRRLFQFSKLDENKITLLEKAINSSKRDEIKSMHIGLSQVSAELIQTDGFKKIFALIAENNISYSLSLDDTGFDLLKANSQFLTSNLKGIKLETQALPTPTLLNETIELLSHLSEKIKLPLPPSVQKLSISVVKKDPWKLRFGYPVLLLPDSLKKLKLKNFNYGLSFPPSLQKLEIRESCIYEVSELSLIKQIHLKEIIFEGTNFNHLVMGGYRRFFPSLPPKVEKLEISGKNDLNAKVDYFVNSTPYLKELILDGVQINFYFPPKLEKLHIKGVDIISPKFQAENFASLNDLKELTFERIIFTGPHYASFPVNLVKLKLIGISFFERRDLTDLNFLKELVLEDFDGQLPSLPPHLEKLKIRGVHGIKKLTDNYYYPISNDYFSSLSQLKELSFENFDGQLPPLPPNLEKLEIKTAAGYKFNFDKLILAITKNPTVLTKLKSLIINRRESIDELNNVKHKEGLSLVVYKLKAALTPDGTHQKTFSP